MEAREMRRKLARERGLTLVFAAFGMVMMLGSAAIAVDMGYLRYVRRQMQAAADSAAIAGAAEYDYGDVVAAGKADATKNGFTDGSAGADVDVHSPPISGPHAGEDGYVEVIISQNQPTFFAQVLNVKSPTVSARAVAFGGESGNNCIYALNPTASGSYSQSSASASTISNCGIVVDSSSSSAMSITGGGKVQAGSVNIVGGLSTSGGSTVSPTAATGIIPEADPLAYLQIPSVPGIPNEDTLGLCTVQSSQMSCNISGGHTSAPGTSPGPDILSPGVYSNIDLSGTSYIELQSGLYYIAGGGINSSGGSSITGTVGGTGVTIYNSGPLSNPSACKSVNVSGAGTVNLTAPMSGALEGVLFFQNRSCSAQVTFSGGSNFSITGALYAADAVLTYSGGSQGQNNYTILVANTITISGGSALVNNDYSSLSSGNSPIHRAVLVE
jgi:hypothetical protein